MSGISIYHLILKSIIFHVMGSSTVVVLGVIVRPAEEMHRYDERESNDNDDIARKCHGLRLDRSRLESLTTDDVDRIVSPSGDDNGRRFSVLSSYTIRSRTTQSPISERMRLQETIGNVSVPIYGANVIVTLSPCEVGQICPTASIESLTGKTYKNDITIPEGFTPSRTEQEAKSALAYFFNVNVKHVSDLSLEVYPSEYGDYLAYIGDVLVPGTKGERGNSATDGTNTQLYDVILDAHSLSLLYSCSRLENISVSTERNGRSRQLQRQQQQQQQQQRQQNFHSDITANTSATQQEQRLRRQQEREINCQSCATNRENIDIDSPSLQVVDCEVRTMYLNNNDNNNKVTKCTQDNSTGRIGTGPIKHLYWEGTYDCDSTTHDCRIVPIGGENSCNDAVSDTHYAAITTLEFYQNHLGVKGGLRELQSNPQPVKAFVHYDFAYCNAFFRGSTNSLYFGDCDCRYWTPLPTIDIVAHELTHGITKYSSALAYEFEAGGINEGISDVMGVVIEFLINDSYDTPDFQIGETLGNTIRNMEHPEEQGFGSVSNMCDYTEDLEPHFASGPFGLAYVRAVRECEQSSCAGRVNYGSIDGNSNFNTNSNARLRVCAILIGSSMMYSNIQGLTKFSDYNDAASATCSLVEEFFISLEPDYTSCGYEDVQNFLRQGWCSVGIKLDSSCGAESMCPDDGTYVTNFDCSDVNEGVVVVDVDSIDESSNGVGSTLTNALYKLWALIQRWVPFFPV